MEGPRSVSSGVPGVRVGSRVQQRICGPSSNLPDEANGPSFSDKRTVEEMPVSHCFVLISWCDLEVLSALPLKYSCCDYSAF